MTDYDEPHGPEFIRAVRVGNTITPESTNMLTFAEGAQEFIDLFKAEAAAAEKALQTQAQHIAKLELKLKNIKRMIEGRTHYEYANAKLAALEGLLLLILDEVGNDNISDDVSPDA